MVFDSSPAEAEEELGQIELIDVAAPNLFQ
jgi:hypothetical protein